MRVGWWKFRSVDLAYADEFNGEEDNAPGSRTISGGLSGNWAVGNDVSTVTLRSGRLRERRRRRRTQIPQGQ